MLTAFLKKYTVPFLKHFALLTAGEAESMRLFGPGRLSETMRGRLGDFLAVPLHPSSISLKPRGAEAKILAAAHSGLTPEEMVIPLAVA